MSETGQRKIIVNNKSVAGEGEIPRDILIVVSKLKNYIKTKHDMNTSGDVMEKLSDKLRALVDEAVIWARSDGRKTLMGRDFK